MPEITLAATCPSCGATSSVATCAGGLMGDRTSERRGCDHVLDIRFGTVFFTTVVFRTADGVRTVPAEPVPPADPAPAGARKSAEC